MPDNQRGGELEDFIAAMIPRDDPTWPRAKRYLEGIPDEERRFSARKFTRAHVHAWLATRKAPRPMGGAITAQDLRHDTPMAATFVDWLRKLFDF